MTLNKEKKIYFTDINEKIDIHKIENNLEKILKEENVSDNKKFREEWDELQKISIIIEGYKKKISGNTNNSEEKIEEEKTIKIIYEEIERKKEETYFQLEKKMSEIEETIGENFNSINKLNECQKKYYQLEQITKILEYEPGEKDAEEGKNICKERIEELRKKIRLEYKNKNNHDSFKREREEKLGEVLNSKDKKYEMQLIKERIGIEKNKERKEELQEIYKLISNYTTK